MAKVTRKTASKQARKKASGAKKTAAKRASTKTTKAPAKPLADMVREASLPKPTAPAEGAVPPMPVEELPEMLGTYARELNRCDRWPLDYVVVAMLYAASVAIGNAFHVKVKEGWIMPAILWILLVGRPGTTKTPPLEHLLGPIKRRDADAFAAYREELRAWEADKEGQATNPRPRRTHHLVGDSTREALVARLEHLPRGLGVHMDEAAGWVLSMDAYRKAGDREWWLSVWNGRQVDVLRKTAGEVLVEFPFVGFIGTIQPVKLYVLGKAGDGFGVRLLIAYPDAQAKPYLSSEQMDPRHAERWAEVLGTLLSFTMADEDGRAVPHVLPLTPGAFQLFRAWSETNTDKANREPEDLADLFPKLESYVPRLALVLELLHLACDGTGTPKSIGERAMQGAIQLAGYFEATARKVHFETHEADVVDKLDKRQARLYTALPARFKTAQGQDIAAKVGMPESTFRRFLRRKDLFRKLSHGEHEKTLEA